MFHCSLFTKNIMWYWFFSMALKKWIQLNLLFSVTLIFSSVQKIYFRIKNTWQNFFEYKDFIKNVFFLIVWHALFVSGISRLNHINCSRPHRDHLYSPHWWKIYICICIVFMHSMNLKNLHIYVPPLFSVIFLSHIFFSFSR